MAIKEITQSLGHNLGLEPTDQNPKQGSLKGVPLPKDASLEHSMFYPNNLKDKVCCPDIYAVDFKNAAGKIKDALKPRQLTGSGEIGGG